MKAFLLALWEVAEVVIVAVIAVLIIRTFLIQPFLVSGASMEPNFNSGNYLIIDEITYSFREPKRGEVIVFRYPENPSTFYIKRVVGLPNEKVTIGKGIVSVVGGNDAIVLDEPYLPAGLKTSGNISVTLSGSEYFVLGDNRNYSYDSRSWGALPKENIIGVARLRLYPLNRVQAFSY
ncbi:MAG: signal peptidase I [Candidatus Zambryskibacteria bacterium RIFCSPLOWO2_01_FULL_45_43]|uniref:Signal peptidase I n=2 Tax=Parcubacteria group TaxID=1794811 RepID=A0A1G1ZTD4_9BACT|nr:MAG: signal peptidase I [Candidatus Harrisonbacteria bacterium RIFCSPLOWO2_02_FULL_45_10c]OHB06075.1 MAG: signal peptidase I [Candidatus Zambryskibacteria bacterium RIFCSPLOWO2_01_FULL_45_43]